MAYNEEGRINDSTDGSSIDYTANRNRYHGIINRFGELILSSFDEFIASELAVLPPGSNPSVRLAKKLESLRQSGKKPFDWLRKRGTHYVKSSDSPCYRA